MKKIVQLLVGGMGGRPDGILRVEFQLLKVVSLT